MFAVGDIVIYKQSGVCSIDGIDEMDIMGTSDLYYTLKPLYGTGTLYIPVNTKEYFRKIITSDEAESWVEKFSGIESNLCPDKRIGAQKEFYNKILQSHDFSELIALIKGLYSKRKLQKGKKNLTATEEGVLSSAETIVYQELATALAVEIGEVKSKVLKTCS